MTFDAGGTLLEPWPSVGHIYAEVAAEFGVPNADPARLNRQFRYLWRNHPNFDHSRRAWAEVVASTFVGTCRRSACDAFFPQLYERFARREAWHLFPDVRPALQALQAKGLKLGVVSNWDERLHSLLKEFELAAYFEAVVISLETGFRKPSPRIFERAAHLLGVPAGAILHVGDSAKEDVAGAQAAGCWGVRIRRGSEPVSEGEVASLEELASRLEAPGGAVSSAFADWNP